MINNNQVIFQWTYGAFYLLDYQIFFKQIARTSIVLNTRTSLSNTGPLSFWSLMRKTKSRPKIWKTQSIVPKACQSDWKSHLNVCVVIPLILFQWATVKTIRTLCFMEELNLKTILYVNTL